MISVLPDASMAARPSSFSFFAPSLKKAVASLFALSPNEFLGIVHDRAPMVLLPSQYEAWLAGGRDALELVGTHPVARTFVVEPAHV